MGKDLASVWYFVSDVEGKGRELISSDGPLPFGGEHCIRLTTWVTRLYAPQVNLVECPSSRQ